MHLARTVFIGLLLAVALTGGIMGIISFVESRKLANTTNASTKAYMSQQGGWTAAEMLAIQTNQRLYVQSELAALPKTSGTSNYLCPLNVLPASGLCTTIGSNGKPSFAGASLPNIPTVQQGTVQVIGGIATITFPFAFASIPSLTCTPFQTGLNQGQFTFSTIVTKLSTTSATVLVQSTAQGQTSNAPFAASLNWIATTTSG